MTAHDGRLVIGQATALAVLIAGCSSDAAHLVGQLRTGKPPPDWLVLAPQISAYLKPNRDVAPQPIMVCESSDEMRASVNGEGPEGCSEITPDLQPVTVKRVVKIGNARYIAEVSQHAWLAWVGAANLSPVVPAGTIVQPDSSGTLSFDADETDASSDAKLEGRVRVRVLDGVPGHPADLHVRVLSGAHAGQTGYVSGMSFRSASGYAVNSFASVRAAGS